MEQEIIVNKRNTPVKWWRDYFTWLFVILLIAGFVVSSLESGDWISGSVFIPGIGIMVILVIYLSRKLVPEPLDIPHPSLETCIVLGWLAIFFILDMVTKGNVPLGNEFGRWLWFIVLPLAFLYLARKREGGIKSLLGSIGLHRPGKVVLLGLVAYIVMIPVIPVIVPEDQLKEFTELFGNPLSALGMLLLAFVLSLLTAATTEEVLFRGLLQSRLARVTGNEVRACLITAFIFGIYHLPYAYYSEYWPTQGNLAWAVSSVLSEQMLTGLLLGVMWIRTRNILVPILFHALVNTMPIMTSLHFFGP